MSWECSALRREGSGRRGEHFHVHKYLMGGSKKIETVPLQWYPEKVQQTTGTN